MSDHDVPFASFPFAADGSAAKVRDEDRPLLDHALILHRQGRRRASHFGTPLLLDHAMNMMLSLLIAEIEEIVVSESAVLMANEAPRDGTGALIDQLVHAGLAAATGAKPGRRTVGLTPLGSARMRGFVAESASL